MRRFATRRVYDRLTGSFFGLLAPIATLHAQSTPAANRPLCASTAHPGQFGRPNKKVDESIDLHPNGQ
jgi:hypothetical protein